MRLLRLLLLRSAQKKHMRKPRGGIIMKINNDSYRSDPTCTAVIGSMTMALKAQRLLASRTLRAEVIKVAHATAKRGCIYGLEFACALTGSVRATLEERGIEIKEFLR